MKSGKKDLAWALALLFLSIVVFYMAIGFPTLPKQRIGAGTFPILIAIALGACSVGLAAVSFKKTSFSQESFQWYRRSALLSLLALCAIPLSIVFLADHIGFTLAAATPATALMALLRRGRILQSAVLCFGFSALLYFVFTKGLLVPLAPGVFRTAAGL